MDPVEDHVPDEYRHPRWVETPTHPTVRNRKTPFLTRRKAQGDGSRKTIAFTASGFPASSIMSIVILKPRTRSSRSSKR